MSKSNPFDRLTSETNNIKHNKPKVTKIEMDHPIYATKHNKDTNQTKNKKASDKTTYSSVRITTDTSIKLRALLKVTNCNNRDELINKMIRLSKSNLLNDAQQNKYEKAYRLYKTQKKQDKELDKL